MMTLDPAPDLSASRAQASVASSIAAAFPTDFVWGTATSSYQIEGAVNEGGRGRSIWDDFAATPGKTFRGETGAIAIDHYHRYAEDIALMASQGIRHYRFSVAWPRIFPDGTGAANEAGLDFYDRLVDTLIAHDIAPALTLYHWDLPSVLQSKGGWLVRDTAYAFADYAALLFKRLGDRVFFWQTLNEPVCSAFLGYGVGAHAPGQARLADALTAAHYLLLGHGLAIQRLRAAATPKHKLGITLNLNHVYGEESLDGEELSATTQQAIFQSDAMNTWFLDPIFKGYYPDEIVRQLGKDADAQKAIPIDDRDMAIISTPIDFLGVNYYSRAVVRGAERNGSIEVEQVCPVPGASYTMTGWEIYPPGMTDLLLRVHRDYAPKEIYITENGAAFDDVVATDGQVHDVRRIEFLQDHFKACAEALRQGVPVKGYFAWSLFDNYEWAQGYRKRFGLVYVDFASQQRIVKDSGHWYAEFLAVHRQQ